MEGRQRLKRPDPERIEPIRNWGLMYRQPKPDTNPGEHDVHPEKAYSVGGIGEAVASAVELGYRVINEQIRLGQQIAPRFSDGAYRLGTGDARDVIEKIVRAYVDFGTFCFEAVTSLATAAGSARPQGPAPVHDGGVSLDLIASQPTRVTFDLRPQEGAPPLIVYELRTPDPASPPLTDVRLAPAEEGRQACLRLRVPPAQPPGLYSGVVVDAGGQVRGTLSVLVGEAAGGDGSAP